MMDTRPASPAQAAGEDAVTRDAEYRRIARALVPLRVFLGATFAFAGLQKLASTAYLDPRAPSGVAAQMHAAAATSPIGGVMTFRPPRSSLRPGHRSR